MTRLVLSLGLRPAQAAYPLRLAAPQSNRNNATTIKMRTKAMANGYFWSEAQLICAVVAIGLALIGAVVAILLSYRSAGKKSAALCVGILAVSMLSGAAAMIYYGQLSAERNTLDRVDEQLVTMIYKTQQVDFVLRNISSFPATDTRFEYYWALTKDHLEVLQEPLVKNSDLDALRDFFASSNTTLKPALADLGLFYGGLIGIFFAGLLTTISAAYLISRLFFNAEDATNIGGAVALITIFAYPVFRLITQEDNQISPTILLLLLPIGFSVLLHVCCRKQSLLPIHISACFVLIGACALFCFSSIAMVTSGRHNLAKLVLLLDTKLPEINLHATLLNDKLTELEQAGFESENFIIGTISYDLWLAVGAFEETRANLNNSLLSEEDLIDDFPHRDDFQGFTEAFDLEKNAVQE